MAVDDLQFLMLMARVAAMEADVIEIRNQDEEIKEDDMFERGGGDEDSGTFSGHVYVGGRYFYDADVSARSHGGGSEIVDNSTAKAWLKIDAIAGTCSFEDECAEPPFSTGEEWYDLSQTFGDIHLPRIN